MSRYLIHVTLDTGDSRRSARADVDDAVLTLVAQNLKDALGAGDVETALVGPPGYVLKATSAGGALIATVLARGDVMTPVVTFAVATRARHAERLWRMLHDVDRGGLPAPLTDPDVTPAPPWLGARLEVGAIEHAAALGWIADYERCAAWAWIEGAAE